MKNYLTKKARIPKRLEILLIEVKYLITHDLRISGLGLTVDDRESLALVVDGGVSLKLAHEVEALAAKWAKLLLAGLETKSKKVRPE